MRIVLLSPHFKPHPGGVADYTFELCQQFHKLGHEVVVVTSTRAPFDKGPFKILTVPSWNLWQAIKIKRVLKSLKADQHIIQWTPLAFAPKTFGIAPGLVFLIFLMMNLKKILFVHESNYPVQLNPKGILIGLPHFFQFIKMLFFIGLSRDRVVFSHKANELKWRSYLPFSFIRKQMRTIAVFSNIPVMAAPELKLDKTILRLGYFGGLHPTNDIELVRDAYDLCQDKSKKKVSLEIIGIDPNNCPDVFQDEGISVLGRLDEKELSQKLHEFDLLVIPFMDGASTRRGTLMAGLSHKCAVVTTSAWNTHSDIPWNQIVSVTDILDRLGFCQEVLRLAQDDDSRIELASAGQRYYQVHFSPQVCAQNLLSL